MSISTGDNAKVKILVLGGCGFIGRHVVELLVSKEEVGQVRVVDKTPPQLAFLSKAHSALFDDPRVEFKSANLMNPESCRAACSGDWSAAVVTAGETRAGLSPEVVEVSGRALSRTVADVCLELHLPVVYVSSGAMYNGELCDEQSAPKPWTVEARLCAEMEELLRRSPGPLRILRPGLVYGPGDRTGLAPTLLLGAIYKSLKEPLKLLWSPRLAMNTVHVRDLARAVVHCVRELTGDSGPSPPVVYHAVDDAHSTQGSLADLVADMFHVKVDYYGNVLSAVATCDVSSLVSEADGRHMSEWARLCPESALEPRVRPDRLAGTPLSLRPSAALPRPLHPTPTPHLLMEMLEYFAELGQFPLTLLD